MKTAMFILTYVTLAVLANGCGRDPRTSATLRSPEQIKAITDTFVVGQTTMGQAFDALGPFNGQGSTPSAEYVFYWTDDGKDTLISFGAICSFSGDIGCYSGAVHRN